MRDRVANTDKSLLTAADRAGSWGIGFGVAAIAILGTSSWLSNYFGNMVCNVGVGLWLFVWTLGLGFSWAALRNVQASATPQLLRRKAFGGLALAVASIALICGVLYAFGV